MFVLFPNSSYTGEQWPCQIQKLKKLYVLGTYKDKLKLNINLLGHQVSTRPKEGTVLMV